MAKEHTIGFSKIINDLALETLYMPEEDVLIQSRDVNRPGIELNGFYDYFDNLRINVIGMGEISMLEHFSPEERYEVLDRFFSKKPPAVIISRNLDVEKFRMVEIAKEHNVCLVRTQDSTSDVVANLVSLLNLELAPRITRHGVLIEVYGEGILLVGDSGVGKSETAIEVVKRGHRLIADDAVEIRRVSSRSLVGQAPENIRHFIELRGIGIINAMRIFGMGAIKQSEKIDMVINLEQWDKSKVYDRMGIDNEYTELLGIKLPVMTIPVKPGRNLAVIIEVAAMNNRQKKMGYNAAKELFSNYFGSDIMEAKDIKRELQF